MAKKANLLRNRDPKREEADRTGWVSNFSNMNVDPDLICKTLENVGLTVYQDKDRIFGPKEEAKKVIEVLSENFKVGHKKK